MRNRRLKFICDTVTLKLATTDTPFTSKGRKGAPCRMPIAHMEGNYFVDAGSLKKMEEKGQIVFQYADESGKIQAVLKNNWHWFALLGLATGVAITIHFQSNRLLGRSVAG